MRKLAPWYALAALVVVLDQFAKYWVSFSFGHAEVRAVTGFFNLVLTYNKGAAFSFLAAASGWQRGFFIGIALVAMVVISVLLARHAGEKLFCLSLALILGGAIGNVLDRIALGYVVDFLDFHVGRLALAGVQPGRFGDHRGRSAAGRGQFSSGCQAGGRSAMSALIGFDQSPAHSFIGVQSWKSC